MKMSVALGLLFSWIVWEIVADLERNRLRAFIAQSLGTVSPAFFKKRRRSPFARKISAAAYADFFDLAAQGLSAGLPLERAWREALAYESNGRVRDVLEAFPRAVQSGRSPEQALAHTMEQANDEDVVLVMALLKQSLKHGQAIAKTLVRQSERLREAHLLDAERRAQTASLKLLFPIFVFILPAVFLVLFGPFLIRLSQGAMGL